MEFHDLLGMSLKHALFNELFEAHDVDVIYRYDRKNENQQDEYRAEVADLGLYFVFNEEQNLKALFLSRVAQSGFNPFTGKDPREDAFENGTQAAEYAASEQLEFIHGPAKGDDLFGPLPEWLRIIYEDYTLQYQFDKSGIELVTYNQSLPNQS